MARVPTALIIARRIREAIRDGTLSPGTRMVETRLAEQLGVSRAPVREALQRLIQEGLAVNKRRGVFIRELTSEDVLDVYLARTACEAAAAEAIMQASDAVCWDVLEAALGCLEEAAAESDLRSTLEADRHFHERLVEAAGSPRLTRMFTTLLVETAICLHRLEGAYTEGTHLVEEHRRILTALRAGDRDEVSRAITAHMDDAVQHLTGERMAGGS
ncbi:MAG: GntR family transcriptional regulator [Acidimicrobiia bacterium]|nr:GntR family transcriptional regulator [Acidimicrobiia bacterium]